jgi:hypothetical protein
MDTDGLLSVYLALAGMLATLVTLIVAGLIAVYQIVDKQTPKRSLNDIVGLFIQIVFIIYTSLLLIISMASAWLLAAKPKLILSGVDVTTIPQDAWVLFTVIIGMLVSYGIFIVILFKGRALFDNIKYIQITSNRFSPNHFSDYLFAQYASAPFYFSNRYFYFGSETTDEERELKDAEDKAKFETEKADYDSKKKRLADAKDPLGELFQYSLRSDSPDDVENIIMPIVKEKLLMYVISNESLSHLGDYIQEAVTTMLASSSGLPSVGTKKAYIDMLVELAKEIIDRKEYVIAANITSQLHVITRNDKNEFLRLYSIKAIDDITSRYDDSTMDVMDAREYMEHYEKFSLIVARMAENYYHNLDKMTPVAIIEDNHHENESFGGAMVNYLLPNKRFYEQFDDIFPVIYFDAIDLSAEAFAGAMARSDTVIHNVGASRYSYGDTLSSLYYIFYDYGKHGVDAGHYDVVHNCIYRLKRGIKFMKEHDLNEINESIADYLYSLGVMVASLPDDSSFGKIMHQDKREVLAGIASSLNENILDMSTFESRKSSMDHSLFGYIDKPGADEFVSMIDWKKGQSRIEFF